jgi:hypothetical protein
VSGGASGDAGGGGDTRGGSERDSSSSSSDGGGSGGLSASGGASGGAREGEEAGGAGAGGAGGSVGKRPRYAAAAEGVHVLEEEEVDMVSQVADLGRVEDLGTEAPTNKEYRREAPTDSHYRRFEGTTKEDRDACAADNGALYASMQGRLAESIALGVEARRLHNLSRLLRGGLDE